jgi:hypothetical protein
MRFKLSDESLTCISDRTPNSAPVTHEAAPTSQPQGTDAEALRYVLIAAKQIL